MEIRSASRSATFVGSLRNRRKISTCKILICWAAWDCQTARSIRLTSVQSGGGLTSVQSGGAKQLGGAGRGARSRTGSMCGPRIWSRRLSAGLFSHSRELPVTCQWQS